MLEAIILGIIQGITEFLPISSTAHLILVPKIFKWTGTVDTLTFDIGLHAGTLLAVFVFFIKDWLRIIIYDKKLFLYIIISTIPAALAGLFLEELAENTLRSSKIIAINLIGIGIFLFVTDRKAGTRSIHELGILDCLFIGFFQAIALIPGVSRSGITMGAGFLKGLKREDSARFSFLLSTPIIGGAILVGARRLSQEPELDISIFFCGVIASFIAGALAIGWLLKYLKSHRIDIFVYYRILLGLSILLIRP